MDVCGRFDLDTAFRYARALSEYDLFQPYGGFPNWAAVDSGDVTLPDLPGMGFKGKADLYRAMQALSA